MPLINTAAVETARYQLRQACLRGLLAELFLYADVLNVNGWVVAMVAHGEIEQEERPAAQRLAAGDGHGHDTGLLGVGLD